MTLLLYRGRLVKLPLFITRMTTRELIEYELTLWSWMDKTKGSANVARELNAVHREVEWRAQDTDWQQTR